MSLKEVGLILFWCEGSKIDREPIRKRRYGKRLEFVSSAVKMLEIFVRFLEEIYGVKPTQMKVRVFIHEGQNEKQIKKFWSKKLGIPADNFYKTQIKKRGSNRRKVICQVTSLQTSPFKGMNGYFKILDVAGELPKVWTELYLLHKQLDVGHIEVGGTPKGETVKLRVNPFFRHVLIAGITQKGKTHLQIVIQEEFLKYRIPSLVMDTQGEFVYLNEYSPNAIVVEEIRFEDLLGYLKQRKTVVYNLQGLSYPVKARRVYEVLSQLTAAKEQDYKHAENDVRLLEIPPIIVDVDEAEIYAPELYTSILDPQCKEVLVDVAKRGSKYGIGLMVASQRPPQLNVDVRSQCNSCCMFHINDVGSRKVLGILPYITRFELHRVKNLLKGQCIITGELVEHPILVYVRDIQTRRAKKTDFEDMLGLSSVSIQAPKTVPNNVGLIQCQNGEVVDPQSGEVVERVHQQPQPAYEEGNLHVPRARTRHYGASGPLGTSDRESLRIMRELRRRMRAKLSDD